MREVSRNEYLTRLESKRGNRMVKVITGIRRCGKSYLTISLTDFLLKPDALDWWQAAKTFALTFCTRAYTICQEQFA